MSLWITPKQKYTSENTSLNQIPAVFKKISFKGKNADIGGGKYNKSSEFVASQKAFNMVYDPFNRNEAHNKMVIDLIKDGQCQTATISNCLNVIMEEENRILAIKQAFNALEIGGRLFIAIYEGDKSNKGKVTTKGYQLNRKLKDYLPEITSVFKNVTIKNQTIIATKEV